jgi:hypothetical protein
VAASSSKKFDASDTRQVGCQHPLSIGLGTKKGEDTEGILGSMGNVDEDWVSHTPKNLVVPILLTSNLAASSSLTSSFSSLFLEISRID